MNFDSRPLHDVADTPAPSSVAETRAIVRNCLDVITSPENVSRVFGRLFGVESLPPQPFLYGSARVGDDLVISHIVERIDDGLKPSCLELGCGETYGRDESQYGSPWLARALAMTLGDRISLLSTDINGDAEHQVGDWQRMSVIIVHPDRQVCHLSHCDVMRRHAEFSDISALDPVTLRLQPFTFEALQESEHILSQRLASTRHKLLHEQGLDIADGARIFVRPALDREVEATIFNLDVRCGVDFTDLCATFPRRQFEIVFARNVEPVWLSKLGSWVRDVVRPEGEYLLSSEADQTFGS